ncbi:MAG TPA: alpha-glucan family phosphorylase, partial [Candidatus Woesebacteria bacterium]|nr:alpha-glucan family phosphorylase [Candidatus Woesebacteria bacterium]
SALRLIKNKIVYTNHTLVAAGNMSYPISALTPLAEPYANKMEISTQQLLSLGSSGNPDSFSVTSAALNVSHVASGVSQVHTDLSKQVWPDYNWTNITNGVHRGTWQDSQIKLASEDSTNLWQRHYQLKEQLRDYVHATTGFGYDHHRMVVSWARRIAGYKQLSALFSDIEALRRIATQQGREIQFLVSGKAHFGDSFSKDVLKEVIQHFSSDLSGYALFIPNYNIEIAQFLTKGSDVWLNTPIKGKEASGTSGMKAISNGVLQITVQDGWTSEVDWNSVGWTLNPDDLTSSLYEMLQNAQNMYFQKNDRGFSEEWVSRMKASIELFDRFSTERMLREYREKLYTA